METYVFSYEVAAKEMADTIIAEFYLVSDDGNDILLIQDSYSVKDYAKVIVENQENKNEYTVAIPVVKAMLNYGAYAQKYFNYNLTTEIGDSNLANSILKDSDKIIAIKDNTINELNQYTLITELTGSSFIKCIGVSLVLLSNTTMRIYFEILI